MPTKNKSEIPVLFATVAEFARIAHVSVPSAYRYIADKEVRAVRLGGRILIPLEEIDRILSGK